MISPAFQLGWRMLVHRRGRLVAAVGAVSFASLILSMELGFFHGFTDSQARLATLFDADLVLMEVRRGHFDAWTELPAARLAQTAALPEVAAVVPLYTTNLVVRHPITRQERRIRALAFAPDMHALKLPELEPLLPRLVERGRVLFDRESRDLFGPTGDGSVLTVNGGLLVVAGHYSIGPTFTTDADMIMSAGTYFHLTGRTQGAAVDWGLVRLRSGVDVGAFRDRLLTVLPSDTVALTPEEMREREVAYTSSVVPIGVAFGFALVVGGAIGLIACYQVLFNEVTDHLPQFATLKAMGFGGDFVRRVVFGQSVLVAGAGLGPGALGGWFLCGEIWRRTGIVMIATPGRIAFVALLTLFICLAAGLLAVRRANQTDPADVFS